MTEADNQTLKPAGQADGKIQQWLADSRMDYCNKSDDNTWSCQLERNGTKRWIVWNAGGGKDFSIPSSWRVTSASSLLGQSRAIGGSKIRIDVSPMLLSGQ
jgi:hypothetical protein